MLWVAVIYEVINWLTDCSTSCWLHLSEVLGNKIALETLELVAKVFIAGDLGVRLTRLEIRVKTLSFLSFDSLIVLGILFDIHSEIDLD